MLRRLRVQNFLCLRDVTIDLAPLLIFVGPNASGKSAILRALQVFSMLPRAPVRGRAGSFHLRGVTLDRLVWRADDKLPIVFQAWFDTDEEEPGYVLEISKVASGWSVTKECLRLGNVRFDSGVEPFSFDTQLRGTITFKPPYPATLGYLTALYKTDPEAARAIQPFQANSQRIGSTWRYVPSASEIAASVFPGPDGAVPYVRETGRGLPWKLRDFAAGPRKDLFARMVKQLGEWFSHIKGVNTPPEGLGVGLSFTTNRSDQEVPAQVESDGVLYALLLLYLTFSMTPQDSLALEDPEQGTHPYLLGERYGWVKDVVEGKAGPHPIRTLLATHSIDFLNKISPEEAVEILRIVEFGPESGTKISTLKDGGELDTLFKVYSGKVGDLWWSGALGGTPGPA